MKKETKYNAKYLWVMGNAWVVLIVLGIPALLLIIMRLFNLFDMPNPFDQLGIMEFIIVIGLIIFTIWIYVSNWWKKRAFELVSEEEEEVLREKFNDNEESFVLKKWGDLTKKGRFIRVGIIAAVIVGGIYADYYFATEDRRFQEEGVSTTATITAIEKKYKRKKVNLIASYQFTVGNVAYNGERTLESGWFLSGGDIGGFPAGEGDQFEVIYLKSDPEKSRIQLEKPAPVTSKRFIQLTASALSSDYPNNDYCQCLAEKTFDKFGLDGIARLYHRNASYWDNEEYNSIKYKQLTNKAGYKEITESCQQ